MVPTLTPYYAQAIQSQQKKKDPSLKVPMLTPYYAHTLQDHQKKKRSQPRGTYADALLNTRHTRPPEEKKTPASRYLRGRPTTHTPYKTTRRRKDLSLQVPTLTPYYAHAIRNHQKKKKNSLKVLMLTPYSAHATQDHQKNKTPKPQGTYADARLRTHRTSPPEEEKTPASKYLR
jgi:hypothetical protein